MEQLIEKEDSVVKRIEDEAPKFDEPALRMIDMEFKDRKKVI